MTFVLGAALFAGAVAWFVIHPVLTGRLAPVGSQYDELTDAEARRRVTLLALRDVEYDRLTGKLDQEDYEALRKELSEEALAALEAEEAERAGRGTLDEEVDLDPATLRALRRVREGLASGVTCVACGHVCSAGSRFCSSCGRPLEAGSASGAEG